MLRPESIAEHKTELPEDVHMYDIAGQPPITATTYQRYLDRKRQYDVLIREAVTAHSDWSWMESQKTPDHELAPIIRSRLISDNQVERTWAAVKIQSAPENERGALVRLGLASPDPETRWSAAQMLVHVPITEQMELREMIANKIHTGLGSADAEAQVAAAEMIRWAPMEERPDLIRLGLASAHIQTQRAAAEMLWQTHDDEGIIQTIGRRARAGLNAHTANDQKAAVEMINWAPSGERAELIRIGLTLEHIEAQRAAVKMIRWAPMDERTGLIREGLDSPSAEIQRLSADMIMSARVDDQTALIQKGLESAQTDTRRAAAKLISRMPSKEEADALRAQIADRIHTDLMTDDAQAQRSTAELLEFTPRDRKKELFKEAQERGLGHLFIEPPLYSDEQVLQDRFSRTAFNKTGSGLTLLGGRLKDRSVIRHISPQAFIAWQKAYEDRSMWKDAGFDYVPIEPIQSFRLSADKQVDVFSGVLDLSLDEWGKISSDFVEALEHDRDRILATIQAHRISHGHSHDKNFVLRFFRDPDGKPDLARKPRLYLIDLDESESS